MKKNLATLLFACVILTSLSCNKILKKCYKCVDINAIDTELCGKSKNEIKEWEQKNNGTCVEKD